MPIVLDGTSGITTPDLTDTSLTSGRVVYAGASGNLTGSASLTFDGSNLICGGTLQALGTVQSSSGADLSLNANGANRDVFLKVNGTTLMTVQGSTGRVGIGTATPNAKFTVSNSGVEALEFSPTGSTGGGAFIQGYNRSTFVYTPVEIIASSFAVYPQGGASKVNVNFNGLGLGTGTPSSGIGITFPATQDPSSNANTLDDYEEGTWTPTINIGGVTTGITYSVQVGAYVKVGNLCNVSGYVLLSSKGGLSGNVVFTGLPFATRNLSNNYPAPSIAAYGNLTGITAYGVAVDLGPNSTGAIFIYGNGTALSALQGGNITNSFTYEFTFSYPTN
jgi:hypothetical protein